MNKIVKGKLSTHIRGFGFIRNEDRNLPDVFVFNNNINGAMHNDEVLGEIIKESDGGKKREAKIIKIIKRANERIIGTLKISGNFGFVVPDETRLNNDIYIPKNGFNGAKDRHKVVVKIIKWPHPGQNPTGKIIEDLGHRSDLGVDILSIVKKYKLSGKFSEKVEKEAAEIKEKISQNEIKRRKDLRKKTIITIDGIKAKDKDDAVSLKILANGNYLLGVHIADVSHYVKEKSILNKEALERTTSVYFPDRVIPMLPEKLSNLVCSLTPKRDRLTLSIDMEINSKGEVVSHNIYESVIKTKEGMIYNDISDILEKNNEKLKKRYYNLLKTLWLMEKLAKILMKKRELRGSIDFNFPELEITLNKKGEPIEIKKTERRIANRIIEEFMMICNETIAKFFNNLKVPFIYRTHESPNSEKVQAISNLVKKFGYEIKTVSGKISPKQIQELLKKTEGQKEEKVINLLMLRSLEQAKYNSKNLGHFGLAVENYCHFTSPIRRYPDLQIHRIIKLFISKKLTTQKSKEMENLVSIAAAKSSINERIAAEAEMEANDLKKTQYMSYHIGKEFNGNISDLTSFGLFVELENGICGLVRIGSMTDDYYCYDEKNLLIRGRKTKKTWQIGDKVRVKVEKADIDQRKIDFILA